MWPQLHLIIRKNKYMLHLVRELLLLLSLLLCERTKKNPRQGRLEVTKYTLQTYLISAQYGAHTCTREVAWQH